MYQISDKLPWVTLLIIYILSIYLISFRGFLFHKTLTGRELCLEVLYFEGALPLKYKVFFIFFMILRTERHSLFLYDTLLENCLLFFPSITPRTSGKF